MNIYDPYEREKYYSDDFLKNQRHVNDKVEQELVELSSRLRLTRRFSRILPVTSLSPDMVAKIST